MSEKHTCPRRAESFGKARTEQGKDTYKRGHGLVTQSRGCSYCGSMHPDDFMQAVRDGKEIGPTDKSYKAYVYEPLTDEQKAQARRRSIGSYVGTGMSEADATKLVDSEPFIGSGAQIGKFYYQHLTDEQRHEFIRLLNERAVKIGYPGYFYVLPYFIQRAES